MDVPDRLYKYRSLDGEDKEFTCRILTHNEVYFASCAKFNDPFDSCPRIDIPKDFAKHKRILKQLYPDWPETRLDAQVLAELQPEKIRRCRQTVNNEVRRVNEALGIFSVSAKRDSILMWSHYADHHRGICIEFKTTAGRLFGCDLLEVRYQADYPRLDIYDKPDLEFGKQCLSTKAEDWKHEAEWRIIYRKTGPQRLLPESEELSGVILGARISDSNRQLVSKCLSGRDHTIPLYEARECENRFGLDIIPIA